MTGATTPALAAAPLALPLLDPAVLDVPAPSPPSQLAPPPGTARRTAHLLRLACRRRRPEPSPALRAPPPAPTPSIHRARVARPHHLGKAGAAEGGSRSRRWIPATACKTPAERIDWFARTRPWHKVPRTIVEAFDARFTGQPVMFELFVLTSMKADLVPQYAQMNAEAATGEVACAMAGGLLVKVGGPVAQQVLTTKDAYQQRGQQLSKLEIESLIQQADIARDCLESAVAVCPTMVPAYPALAVLLASIGSPEEGAQYAKKGLAVVKKQRAEASPLQLSSIEALRSAPQDLAIAERTLQQLVDAFAAGMGAQ